MLGSVHFLPLENKHFKDTRISSNEVLNQQGEKLYWEEKNADLFFAEMWEIITMAFWELFHKKCGWRGDTEKSRQKEKVGNEFTYNE